MKHKYNPQIHHRRSIRLKGYDYSKEGLYFITTCVKDRKYLFGEVVWVMEPNSKPEPNDAKMILNDAGKMVENEWLALPDHFPNIRLHEYIVMPNHFHGILEITVGASLVGASKIVGAPKMDAPNTDAPTVGDMIGAFKSITTVEYIHGVTNFGWERFNRKLWQRDYWEHIIRNEQSYRRISEYIINNPAKWLQDKFNPKNL